MYSFFLGIGSNLGDSLSNCRNAIDILAQDSRIRVLDTSDFYTTEPYGFVAQPWFINCVIRVATRMEPVRLLECCLEIERKFKRQRVERWGPRTLDIDILYWGQSIYISRQLRIPHPEAHQRRFVVTPMSVLAPNFLHPIINLRMMELNARLKDTLCILRLDNERRLL